MINGLTPLISIEGVILVYAYGLYLGFDHARIESRQDNKFVWSFHEKFSSAELVAETELDRLYLVKKDKINNLLKKYSNFIKNPLKIHTI